MNALLLKQVDSVGQTCPEAQLALQANDMWFVDPSGGEPLTFREVFLKSEALENIVAGDTSLSWQISATATLIACEFPVGLLHD